jgi:predicted acyltransferase
MGVAMPLSFQSLLKQEKSHILVLYKIVRRSIILFALGMFVNNGADILFWRIPGVLQRFAVAYMVTGIVIAFVPTLGTKQAIEEHLEETDNLLHNSHLPAPKFKSMANAIAPWTGWRSVICCS